MDVVRTPLADAEIDIETFLFRRRALLNALQDCRVKA